MSMNSRIKGAMLGVGIALIGGQLGPQVALPEEVLTVPTMAIAGFMLGPELLKLVKL